MVWGSIASAGASAVMGGGNLMSTLFGGDVSDNWLKSRGEIMGQDLMSMIIAEMYDDEHLDLPAASRRPRSCNPEDVVHHSGLDKGQMKGVLGPLVDGIMTAMRSGDVKQQLVRFAQERAPKTILENAESITTQGQSLGDLVLKGLGEAAKAKAAADVGPRRRGRRSRAAPPLDDVINVEAATATQGGWVGGGSGDFHSKIVSAVMAPVATGINKALKEPKKLEVLADAVADIVPLTTVKRVMKTTLKPQYQQVAKSVRPKLEAYGAVAGEKLLEYLKTKVGVEQDEENASADRAMQKALARSIAKDPQNVDRDLLGPLIEPIIAGIAAVLSGGDWSAMKKGLMWALAGFLCRRYCCSCSCSCGRGDGTDDEDLSDGDEDEDTNATEGAAVEDQ